MPERIYGYELAADMQVTKKLQAGLSYTYTEGKVDADNDGKYDGEKDEYLPGQRISPPRVAFFIVIRKYVILTKFDTI